MTEHDIHHHYTQGARAEGFPYHSVQDYIIIVPDPEHERSSGGIILPDSDVRRCWTGVVKAVGPGLHLKKNGHRIATETEVGMRVAYDLRSFIAVEYVEDGVERVYHVIRDEGVWFSYHDPEGRMRIVRPIAAAEGVIYQ